MKIEADTSNENDSFVYVDVAAPVKSEELNWARRFVIGDTYARFRRARGDSVLFAPAIGTLGEDVEEEAAQRGVYPKEVADSFVDRLRERCDGLSISCDWTKSVVTSQPELRHRTQRIFLELFENGLIYQRNLPAGESDSDRTWHLRCNGYSEWCSRGLEGLPGWNEGAIEAQRKALGQVEGVEIDATILGAGRVPVFTPHPDAIGDSTFIAMSPHHPDVQTIAAALDLEHLRNDSGAPTMALTAMQASVPGVDDLLPIVLTPSVDERFGPTLCLGIPDRDDTDREIAGRLVKPQGLPFRTTGTSSEPRPATRFRLPDPTVSRIGEWGAAIPLLYCDDCGAVPADIDEGPIGSAASSECQAEADKAGVCPECGASAKRDRQVIGGQFDRMWAWMAIPISPENRGSSSLAHCHELDHLLPVRQAVWGAADADAQQFLADRIAARAASELSSQEGDPAEPFAGALACGPVAADKHGGIGSGEELDQLTDEIGSDAVRLAILHSASADKATRWAPASFRHSQRFLDELRNYAEPRLRDSSHPQPLEIDRSTRLRRRLSAWCKAAEAKVSTNLAQMRVHRATYDLMLFLKRIRDFEERCIDSGELSQLDRDAVAVSLLRLIRLAAPCVPNIAAELEAIASGGTSHPLVAVSDKADDLRLAR